MSGDELPDWRDDALVWDALDNFVSGSFNDFKTLMDVLYEEHYNEFDEGTKALVFGVLGRFMQVYHTRRAESNEPWPSFADAVRSAFEDERVKSLMDAAANGSIDSFVQQFKGAE